MKSKNKIILTDPDIDDLSDHALALWARLCRHALIRARAGEADYDLITTTTLCDSEHDLQELADLEYLVFSSVGNEYKIQLIKYRNDHPTPEIFDKLRKYRNKTQRKYRNKKKGQI